jgi:hypothetical protein
MNQRTKTLLISVNFHYLYYGIPPRCRKQRIMDGQGQATVKLRSITAAVAPVAIEIVRKWWDDKGLHFSWDNPIQLRWYKGKLWGNREWEEYRNGNHQYKAPFDLGARTASRSFTGIDYLRDATPELCEQRLQEEFDGYLLIDGEFWQEVGEPRYEINTYGLGHNHGLGWGTSISLTSSYNSNINEGRYYSLLERAECIARATEIAANRGDTKALPLDKTIGQDARVLIPEAVKLNRKRIKKEGPAGCAFINGIERVIQAGAPPAVAGALAIAAVQTELSGVGNRR